MMAPSAGLSGASGAPAKTRTAQSWALPQHGAGRVVALHGAEVAAAHANDVGGELPVAASFADGDGGEARGHAPRPDRRRHADAPAGEDPGAGGEPLEVHEPAEQGVGGWTFDRRSEEHTSELQSPVHLVC